MRIISISKNKNNLKFKSKSNIKDLERLSARQLEKKLKKFNAENSIIFSDFDGTLFPFFEKKTPKELILTKDFQDLLSKLNCSQIPFFILTARSLSQMVDTNLDNSTPQNLNVLAMNGNELFINLPQDEKTDLFIEDLRRNPLYSLEELNINNTKKILTQPIVEKDFLTVTKEIKTELEPYGVRVEDKKTIVMLKWRKLFEKYGEEIEKFLPTIINKFKKAYEPFLIKEDSDKNFAKVITNNEDKNLQIILPNYLSLDKGSGLDSIFNLFRKQQSFPLFFGDSIGKNGDDEYAIEKAQKLDGFGIGVLCRFLKEITDLNKTNINSDNINGRMNKMTSAKYLLNSYQEVIPFLKKYIK